MGIKLYVCRIKILIDTPCPKRQKMYKKEGSFFCPSLQILATAVYRNPIHTIDIYLDLDKIKAKPCLKKNIYKYLQSITPSGEMWLDIKIKGLRVSSVALRSSQDVSFR